jgi:hypothetical protein
MRGDALQHTVDDLGGEVHARLVVANRAAELPQQRQELVGGGAFRAAGRGPGYA